jgi:hypothetical protein
MGRRVHPECGEALALASRANARKLRAFRAIDPVHASGVRWHRSCEKAAHASKPEPSADACAASSSGSGSRPPRRPARRAPGPALRDLPEREYRALLEGVALGQRAARAPARSPELSRMLEDFASELQKLDEGLRLLNAFLARLREQTLEPARTLH